MLHRYVTSSLKFIIRLFVFFCSFSLLLILKSHCNTRESSAWLIQFVMRFETILLCWVGTLNFHRIMKGSTWAMLHIFLKSSFYLIYDTDLFEIWLFCGNECGFENFKFLCSRKKIKKKKIKWTQTWLKIFWKLKDIYKKYILKRKIE